MPVPVLLALLTCTEPPPPPQRADVATPSAPDVGGLPLLHPPFRGDFRATNPFDHAAPGRARHGVLDWRGQLVQGTPGHRGWDWHLPLGTPVLAAADGVVQHAGPTRPFYCEVLGRDVSDQLAVVVQHVAPDGSVWETGVDHLSSVAVRPGDIVRAGDVLGLSGNSGCSTGEHLHFTVARVSADGRVAVDPFGWQGASADPWAVVSRASSIWLWAEAPRVFFLTRRPPDASTWRSPVVVTEVRHQGWRDDLDPNEEYVEVGVDPRFANARVVALDGWRLELPRTSYAFTPGDTVSIEQPLRVYGGTGIARPGVRHLGSATSVLPDAGGRVALLDPSGRTAHELTWGLVVPGPTPVPAREVDACPDPRAGCVRLPLPGGVHALAWSADGTTLAVIVGAERRLLLVAGFPDAPVVTPIERFASGGGPPTDVGGIAWLGHELLWFDAPRFGGERAVYAVVPGLPAADAFPTGLPGTARVVASWGDAVLLSAGEGDAAYLHRWRVGDDRPALLEHHRIEETEVVPSPDGTRLAFVRSRMRQIVRADAPDGPPEWSEPAFEADVRHAWLGDRLVLLRHGALLDAATGSVVAERLRDGLLAQGADGSVVVVSLDGDACWLGPDGERGRVPVGPAPVEALALAVTPKGARLAWARPFVEDGPAGLALAEF